MAIRVSLGLLFLKTIYLKFYIVVASMPKVGKVQIRPAGQIRPAKNFCPARGIAFQHMLVIVYVKCKFLLFFEKYGLTTPIFLKRPVD